MQFFAIPDTSSGHPRFANWVLIWLESMQLRHGWQEQLQTGVTAPFLRFRFPATGAYILEQDFEGTEAAPGAWFGLRVNPVATAAATRPTGARAQLTLLSDTTDTLAVAPASLSGDLASTYPRWSVPPGTFSVLLVRDTLYAVCKPPCSRVDTIVLKPNTSVTRNY